MQTVGLEGFRLSVQQSRLWSFQEKSQAYYATCAIDIEGPLDKKRFDLVLQHIIRRHEILRTFFYLPPGMDIPVQAIANQPAYASALISLLSINAQQQQQEVEGCIASLQKSSIAVQQVPLVYSWLLHLSSDHYIWLIHLPALCADASTLQLFVSEFQQLYSTHLEDEQSGSDLLQYVDVAAWQDRLLQEEDSAQQIRYWQDKELPLLDRAQMPFEKGYIIRDDFPARADSYFAPQRLPVALEEALILQIRALAERSGVTLSALLLACWQVVLWRLGAESHFLIGIACNGRVYEELANALGPYTRFVPLDARFEKDLPFAQMLADVTQSMQEAAERQNYFTWETLQNTTEQSLNLPFFPICFEYDRWPAAFTTNALTLTLRQCLSYNEPFFLKLSVLQVDEHLQLEIHYNQERVGNEQARHLASVLSTLLHSIVEQPAAYISALHILPPDEQEYLHKAFQAPALPIPEQTLHQLFEAHVAHAPQQLAVLDAQRCLTYQELNFRANQLARVLRRRGVGPDVMVGLCVHRSVDMIICLLAILKAGGAYVPLDPESPPARLVFQLRDIQAPLLLTQQTLLSNLSAWDGATLCLEAIEEEIRRESTDNLPVLNEAQDIAYVIYTSGSTGVPKGVFIRQQSAVNYTQALCELLACQPGWHYATVSTLAADLGNTAIFCALASGGCLQVLNYETITSGDAFARWAALHPIDVLKIVPSHLSALLAAKQASKTLPRRALILGGEALPFSLLTRLRDAGCSCTIYNHYGPTEVTIGVLVNVPGEVSDIDSYAEAGDERGIVPLGKPIANNAVYILDRNGQRVPVGVTGEIYLGGVGLALGYINQPDQTAERFVPDPFSTQGGARLYKTGDLARYTTHGTIEFIGRNDNQVKMRGYRIELGEIEAILRKCPGVRECVVILREDVPGQASIVAYVVAQRQIHLTSDQLRDFVRQHVPEYMIPAACVVLESFPLTRNGKVDRQQLPQPQERPAVQLVSSAPRSPIEETLLEIWKDYLSISSTGIHDNFFQLGGHSLLATQIVSQIRVVLQVELPIQSLFEAPTIAELAHRVEQVLYGDQSSLMPTLTALERPQELPLSFAQQRLWVLDQLEPDSPAYLNFRPLLLRGLLNTQALERSLDEMIRRHESLRTTFHLQGNQPVQVISPARMFRLPIIDLRELPLEEREPELQRLAEQEAQRPFNLAQGPLLRVYVLQLGAEVSALFITEHHIITDGWSNQVFYRELTALYQAFSRRNASPLSPLPLQYADFALWQRQWLQGEVLEAQLAYWRKQLDGASPLELATDFPRPPVQTFRGAYEAIMLPAPLCLQLGELSQQEGVTLFMLLLAAFQVLLARYSGQDDISVGTPIANRTHAEMEELIGFFVNTLVLRTDLSGDPSFREVLQRVQKVALGAYAHQDVPFEQIVEVIQPTRDMSRSPLFQVMFSMQQSIAMTEQFDLEVSSLDTGYHTSRFDLTFFVTTHARSWHCGVEYNTDLFTASTIQRLLTHWQILLEGLVRSPQMSIYALPLLSQKEQDQLLIAWNTTRPTELTSRNIHTLFEEHAASTPDAIAVVCEDTCLTYQQLNSRANQLAHYLLQLGVAPETNVGIVLERSPWLSIVILAILKTGAAYVPLDPFYPRERLSFMLTDCQASVVLTQQALQEHVPADAIHVICLEQAWSTLEPLSTANPDIAVVADQIAYIIYTSGSTGTPKGVMVTHRNVLRLFKATDSWFHFSARDTWTLFHSYAFDFSVWELWGALLHGGRLVVVPYEVSRSPEAFYTLLATHYVTVLNQTPSAFRQLIQADLVIAQPYALALRWIIFGGEALDLAGLLPWFQRHGDQVPQLVNMYGITETTVHVTYRPLTMRDAMQVTGSLVGIPIPDMQVYILDPHLQPVPIGVAGEIYVGGAGLARGYLHRPALSSERFIAHLFSSQVGERLYRTGDLARFLPSGELQYLGRIDQQVKIRGFRIEPGEIEAQLIQHPAISACTVIVHEDEPGNKRLVAYLVPAHDAVPLSNDLRRYLQERLPDYMIPATYVQLAALPLTANGKVDRKALPLPDTRRPESGEVLALPRTPTEEILAAIWSSVLGIEQVGVYDNFFALGGDSIRSIQVLSQARRRGLELSSQQLFQLQTIAELVHSVSTPEKSWLSTEEIPAWSLVSIEDRRRVPPEVEDAYPLAQMQAGMLFHSQYSPDTAIYHDIFSYHLQAPFERHLFQQALDHMAQEHPILRTSFDLSIFSEPLQLIHQHVEIPLQVEDLRQYQAQEQEARVDSWIEAEKQRPFDWTCPPLLCFQVHRYSEQSFQFTLSFHHAILDGWSVASLLTELFKRYLALLNHENTLADPAPAIQFRHFIALERKLLASSETQQYWKQRLSESTSTLLPRWPSASARTETTSVQTQRVPLTPELSDRLRQLASQCTVPLKSVLLAAHLRVLSLLTGQIDVLTGVVSNGRPETIDGERTLGLFLNTLPFRVALSGGTWRDLIQQTFDAECEMLPHRWYPFAEMQKQQDGQLLFDVAFNFTHFHVYQNLVDLEKNSKSFQVLGQKGFEKTNFPLLVNFSLDPASSEVNLALQWDTQELCHEQVEVIGDYYITVLTAMTHTSSAHYEWQSLLSTQELHQLLFDWNATRAQYPHDTAIHQLFEQQVTRTPDKIAVLFAEEHLSYSALNQRAEQLAAHLQSSGVGSEDLVGICINRSVDLLVGILGILKAGCAYVPLDPMYPAERLAFMLTDSRASIVVSQAELLPLLPDNQARVVLLPLSGEGHERYQRSRPEAVEAGQLAYVIYTSGSTGLPKGTMITHRAAANFFTSMSRKPGMSEQDAVLALTSLSFDIAALELLQPLMLGARVHIITSSDAADGQLLAQWLARSSATLMQATPATWRQLLSAGWEGQDGLKMLCGGEALPPEVAAQLQNKGASLWNMYGPTETTIWSATSQIRGEEEGITIGRAIDNTHIYLLDAHGEPVPIGVVGELYIGGDGLARGYLQRPDLTAEKFLPDPFCGRPGARIYRTGDLARWLANGTIECLGRIDHQVKIRGFRIELGEIEASLARHPFIREAVVARYEDSSHDPRLVAYIVPASLTQNDESASEVTQVQEKQISDWATVWEQTYSETSVSDEPLFNIAGWNSSYTGLPIPAEEMREWLDHTVQRILKLQPRDVLEIGCGTGLLLFRVVPHCAHYTGCDFSQAALASIKQQAVACAFDLSHVSLMQSAADDFRGITDKRYNVVILNSVVQYFPSITYLRRVLEQALQVVQPGGSIFIGDVRSFPLLEAFHTSVLLAQAEPALTLEQFQQRVRDQIAQEQELVIDPAFFYAIAQEFPQITHVEIQLKRGHFENELTRFRYDVILHLEEKKSETYEKYPRLEWQTQGVTLQAVRRLLQESAPERIELCHVPNARLRREIKALTLLASDQRYHTVGKLLQELDTDPSLLQEQIDPEDFYALGDAFPYAVEVAWSGDGANDCYDVLLERHGADISQEPALLVSAGSSSRHAQSRQYSNAPLLARFLQNLVPQLRAYLQRNLPDYMLPSHFVILEALPLTPNGKVDRRALPAPNVDEGYSHRKFVAPRTPLEEVLVVLWRDVLGAQHIGMDDDFFELGGHSLLATQVVSRIRAALHIEIPLRALFEARTIALLAERIERMLRNEQSREIPPILPVAREMPLPLSFAQQRLWFLYQWDPSNPYYNIAGALHLTGRLNYSALERSFATIVRRHEVLRTTFDIQGNHPVQIIAPVVHLSLPIVDLAGLDASRHAALIEQLTTQEFQRPFDLVQGPLLRPILLRTAAENYTLLLTIHHIVFDGWSLGVFIRELVALYHAYSRHLPSPLLPLPLQYADYTVWQRQWLRGPVLEEQLHYWREHLAGAPELLDLPIDHPRPAFQSFKGDTYHFALSAELTQALKGLSQREGVTLFMTLLASFQILLARYSRQQDIVVGTVIANRTRSDIEDLIGFFVNTLVLRTDLSGNPSFRALLNQVRKITLEAYAHQDLPFEYLVEVLQPERNLSYAPLFQVAFVLQNMPVGQLDLPDIAIQPLEASTHTAKNDLLLRMHEDGEKLHGALEYNTDLFECTTIMRLATHLRALLEGIVADPMCAAMELPLSTRQEQQRLLTEWNNTQTELPVDACLQDLLDSSVTQAADCIAAVFEGEHLTYVALHQQANRLAHYLQQQGVGPEVPVGVCLERSLQLVIAFLAILKAGGVYVPLDPAYPRERLTFMALDARLALVLTQPSLRTTLSSLSIRIVEMDALWMLLSNQAASPPKNTALPDNAAYIIYTSGTTGLPKGALLTHMGLLNLALAQARAFGLDERGHMLQMVSPGFDVSVSEIATALVASACLHLAPRERLLPGPELLEILREQAITTMMIPASLLAALPVQPLSVLDTLVVGGEACPAELVERWAPGRRFLNAYGPTETTVCVTLASCQASKGRQSKPPIGKPIANTRLYVLDNYLQPVPQGMPGELYIGGMGVARGYLHRADLTAQAFIPDLFGGEGERLYKTGDRVRYLSDGSIDYLGRVDRQVKVRGHRIELGEIESRLHAHATVQDAAILMREDVPGDARLVAYVVPKPLSQLPIDYLQSRQAEQVEHWKALYEEVYHQTSTSMDPLLNIIGWNSSYTGLPLPAEHMREWVEQTVAQLQALHPQDVLEIGCGTGLILLRLAPHCRHYVGTDFSTVVLKMLEEQVQQRDLKQVQLVEQRADQSLDEWEPGSFDLLVLNSVVQYFPGQEYLQHVLQQAIRLLRPGGTLFIGDVRSLPLLDTFQVSVELAQATSFQTVEHLRQRLAQRRENEEELVLAPHFFQKLTKQYPQISQILVRPKRGNHRNELTCYRYDVLLQIGDKTQESLPVTWIDWGKQAMTMASLREHLSETQPGQLGLSRVPNARIQNDLLATHLLKEVEEHVTVGDLRAILQAQRAEQDVDPEEFWKLGQELSYRVELSWASGRDDGSYEVLLRRFGVEGSITFPETEPGPKEATASEPLAGMLRHQWLQELRTYVKTYLPEYMVPAAFVSLRQMPISPNGKLDHRALPVPDQKRPEGTSQYAAPRTLVEEVLSGLWAEVLSLENVGRHDNFFELGGHSLLATQLVSRIRTTFQTELPLRQIFVTPTVAGLAAHLEQTQQGRQLQPVPPLQPVTREGPLPLSFAQQRLWFIDQLNPLSAAYLMPSAWQLQGKVDIRAIESSLETLILRHESLRTTFEISSRTTAFIQAGQPIQIIHAASTFHLPVVDLSGLALEEREPAAQLLSTQEMQHPCDLTRGPLFRTCLIRLGMQEYVLLLTMHHIISDGWSMQVLGHELSQLYQAFASGQLPSLPPLPIQYADYAFWQRQWLQGEILEQQLAYWWKRLAGAPALKLPADHARPPVQSFRGALYPFVLPQQLSQGLYRLGRQEGSTLFMTLLAAFKTLLYRYTGQTDILLGTDSANRNRQETEDIVGFFINLLALRTDLSGKPSFREVLQRVRETVLGAHMHQETPFEILVERLAPAHTLDSTPLVQALFVLQNLPSHQPQDRHVAHSSANGIMPEVTFRSLVDEVRTAKFDLAVFLQEQEGQLRGTVNYSVDLFEASTIATLIARFEVLLRSIVQQPDSPIDLLNFFTADETMQAEHKKRAQPGRLRLRNNNAWFHLSEANE